MNIYLDEYQYLAPKSIVETFPFKTEEEAKGFSYDDKILSNVKEINGKYYRFYCPVGELGVKSIIKAGEYFNSPVVMDAAYDVGKNWADTH